MEACLGMQVGHTLLRQGTIQAALSAGGLGISLLDLQLCRVTVPSQWWVDPCGGLAPLYPSPAPLPLHCKIDQRSWLCPGNLRSNKGQTRNSVGHLGVAGHVTM